MAKSPTYRVHRLRARELFRAYEVSHVTNSGLVFGHYSDSTGQDVGIAVWRIGGADWPAAEKLIPVGNISLHGVNDAGQFVGVLNENGARPQAVFGAPSPDLLPEAAFVRKHEVIEDRVVCWPGGTFALGMNDRGAIIGCSIKKQNVSGFVWSREHGLVKLESAPQEGSTDKRGADCVPLSISDSGILGFKVDSKIALHWEFSGKLIRKFELDFIEIKKITDAGDILWWTKLPGFTSSSRVLRKGVQTVLPLIDGAADAEARDINSLGEIIGEARLPGGVTGRLPCYWTAAGEPRNLNDLISERDVILDRPRAINDAGWIACQGAYRGRYGTAFVLEPNGT